VRCVMCGRRHYVLDEAWPQSEPALRASDADRERVAEQLREHAGAGRLSTDELSERLETVFAARTLGELEPPLADLPSTERRDRAASFAFAPVFALLALLLTVWAVTGAGAFWPVWILLGVWWFGPLRHRHRWAHGRRSVF
jgi:Domain of unknown function (DUF1707)